MWFKLFQWLGPLYEPCTGFPQLQLTYDTPLRIFSQGMLWYDFTSPVTMTMAVCPTTMLYVLLVLAVLGLLAAVIFTIGLFRQTLLPEPAQPSLQALLEETFQELDDASWEYLSRIRR